MYTRFTRSSSSLYSSRVFFFFTSYAALHPGPIRELSVTVDESVTLNWNTPVNIQRAEEVSEYQIRFKPHGGERYNEITVKDSCTTASIDFMQLMPSKYYTFEVRARNDCGEGEWEETSAFCGMYVQICGDLRISININFME